MFGPIAAIQAVLPYFRRRRRGHVITITSVSGVAAWAGTGIYCGSKHALEGVTQTLAQEVAELGVKVTNVEPGGMRTDYAGRSLVRHAAPDRRLRRRGAQRPADPGRPRRPRARRPGQGGGGHPGDRRHRRPAAAAAPGRGRGALRHPPDRGVPEPRSAAGRRSACRQGSTTRPVSDPVSASIIPSTSSVRRTSAKLRRRFSSAALCSASVTAAVASATTITL